MDAKSIKSHLKEAKEAIKNKEIDKALKLCKVVLKEDRKNYLALVLYGAAAQESGAKNDALNAFKKAIEFSPKQILAWQGLASLYVKDGIENTYNELIPVYKVLLLLETDFKKRKDIVDKVENIWEKYNCTDLVVDCFEAFLDDDDLQASVADMFYKCFLSKDVSNRDCWRKVLLIKISGSETCEDYHNQYCEELYKCREYDVLKKFCLDLITKCDQNVVALEWICRIHFDSFLGLTSKVVDSDYSCCDKLLQLKENIEIGLLVNAAKLFDEKDLTGCRDILNNVIDVSPKNPFVWYFLAKVYLVLNSYEELIFCVANAEKYLVDDVANMKTDLQLWKLEALSNSNVNNCKKCIELCNDILNSNPKDELALKCLIRAGIQLEDWNLVESKLNDLDNDPTLIYLKGLYYFKNDRIDRAVIFLLENIQEEAEHADNFLLLGKLYRQLENNKEALNAFLKAAKLAPHIYTAFLELGNYYRDVNDDLEKARRCYQKAFQLNPRSEETGISLSDVYRKLNYQENNFELLNTVTASGTSTWVWLRLGLYYLDTDNIKSALDCLRSAVRVNPDDSCSWECLADAYYARGSYMSALKCYQKCLELNPKSVYAVFQLASIKQIISLHDESISEFRLLVEQNPDYIPALKGLAEVCLIHAKDLVQRQIICAARDLCEEATNCLTKVLKKNSRLGTIWKLFADCCILVGQLPDKISYLELSSALFDTSAVNLEKDEKVRVSKKQLLDFALKFYLIAVNLNSDEHILSFLWHDIACCYNFQLKSCDISNKERIQKYAIGAAKKSISLASKIWEHWNLLGVIATNEDINDLPLAQHCFVKAIELDNNCAVSWANLGILYLQLGDIQLANEAFQNAQRADPKYARSWIGQAFIAESVDSVETVDLFYHTTQLGYHQESAKGFAEWISKIFKNWETYKKNHHCYYIVEKMSGLQVAITVLTWYTVHYPEDSFASNTLGVLLELSNLNKKAVESSQAALKHVKDEKDIVRSNLGRQLRKIGKFKEAVQTYNEIKQADFTVQCDLALSLFMVGDYAESLSSYEAAIQWFAPDEGAEAQVMIASAALKYLCNFKEEAQMILFQCIQLKPVPVHGLFAACAFGMLNSELKLSKLVLKELAAFEKQSEYIKHIAIFKTYCNVFQSNFDAAINLMSKFVHNHPGDPNLWFSLCLLLLHLIFDGQKDSQRFGNSAAYHARCAMTLGRGNIDISKICSIVSLSQFLSGNVENSLRSAMKAIHLYPNVAESWAVLIAVRFYQGNDYISLLNLITCVKLNFKCSKQLNSWLIVIERKVTSILG